MITEKKLLDGVSISDQSSTAPKASFARSLHERNLENFKLSSKADRESRLLARRGLDRSVAFELGKKLARQSVNRVAFSRPQALQQERKSRHRARECRPKLRSGVTPSKGLGFTKEFSFAASKIADVSDTCNSSEADAVSQCSGLELDFSAHASKSLLTFKPFRRPFFKSRLALEVQRRLRRDTVFAANLLHYTLLWHSRDAAEIDAEITAAELDDLEPSMEDIKRFLRWEFFFSTRKQCREKLINFRRDPLLLEKIYERCYGRLINITSVDDPQLQRHPDQQIPTNLKNSTYSSAPAVSGYASPMKGMPKLLRPAFDLVMRSPMLTRRFSNGKPPIKAKAAKATLVGTKLDSETTNCVYAVFRSFQCELDLFCHCPTGLHLAKQANYILKQAFDTHNIQACVERDLEDGMTVELLVETKVKQEAMASVNAKDAEDSSSSFVISEKVYGVATFVFLQEYIWLEHVAVPKLYQKKGIGSAFLKRLMEISVKRNLPILLFALLGAKQFYVRHGFHVASSFESQYCCEVDVDSNSTAESCKEEKLGVFLQWIPPHKNRRKSSKTFAKLF